MDPARIEAAITPRTRAILPVHLHGRIADMDAILAIARQYGLKVIEDAAQAHGAEYRGHRAGSFGHAACFSFYAGKNLGAAGEGGAIVSRDADLIERARMLRDWGSRQKYLHELKGYNYRMENLQGAILMVKLRHLEDWTERRRRVAAVYDRRFDRIGLPRPVDTGEGDRHVYHVYAIRLGDRDRHFERLRQAGIGVGMHYPVPVHLQPAFTDLNHARGDFPATEALGRETLSLPLFPEMTEDQVEAVAGAVEQNLSLPARTGAR